MKLRRKNRVAVLGCGPAGLFATHALVTSGWEVDIFSKARKSNMFGAQYLHDSIPTLAPLEDADKVEYRLMGSAEDYRRKVYGDSHQGTVSPEELTGQHPCWDIRLAYTRAWELYQWNIIADTTLDRADVAAIMDGGPYALVISSIPAPAICRDPAKHTFNFRKVWAIGDAPEIGQYCPVTCNPWTVVCNGDQSPRWYRVSNLYGHTTAEWPYEPKPPVVGLAEVVKPISTSCDCWQEQRTQFIRVGRYGSWTKGVLSHHAYYTALEAIRS